MTTKRFKEIKETDKHSVVWKIVKGEIKKNDFTKKQWDRFLGGK